MSNIYEGSSGQDKMHDMGMCTFAVDGKTPLSGCDYSWNAGDKYNGGFKDLVSHCACTLTL